MNGGPSEAAFARYIGVAPHPYSSGSTDGQVRFTRSGNRQLNKAVHRIAVTQIGMDGPGRSYYDKRRGVGDSSPAALRSLKRRINRVVFSRLQADEPTVTHNRTQAWMWLRPIPQADGVIARPRALAGVLGDQTLHGGHLVSRGCQQSGEFGTGNLTACAQAGRSVSLPAPIVLGWEVIGERGGDLEEATPRGGQQLRRVVDDTAGPQMPVERHLDHHLTV
jgi:hypothetical protein